MAIPLDKEENKRNDKNSKSKYRLDDSERKLPRPVVFWSDNEKDAFRRNKVVQTRYYMLLDDIETQQKSSQKTIRHEAQKFRRRYKADILCSTDNGSSVGLSEISSAISESVPKRIAREVTSGSDSGSDNNSTWESVPKKGVITKIRKTNVKFSSTDDVIPDADINHIEQVKESTDCSAQRKLRSQSATQGRTIKTPTSSNNNRSRSAMMKIGSYSENEDQVPNPKVQPFISPKDDDQGTLRSNKPIRKPNSIFFDRSQAAYQLRKELHKLAKVRKHGVVKVAFTMEDAIREERNKLSASTKKVAEYIQKLELDQRNMKIDEWTTKTIEPVIS